MAWASAINYRPHESKNNPRHRISPEIAFSATHLFVVIFATLALRSPDPSTSRKLRIQSSGTWHLPSRSVSVGDRSSGSSRILGCENGDSVSPGIPKVTLAL